MDSLVVSLPADMRERLQALAACTGRTVEKCLEDAVFEFIESWEVHLRNVQALNDGDDRPLLRAVND